MLIGNKLVVSDKRRRYDEAIAGCMLRFTNYSCDDYLGAIMYLLHQRTGCYFMYGYNQLPDNYHRWAEPSRAYNCYSDRERISIVKEHKIQGLLHLTLTDEFGSSNHYRSKLKTMEYNSSYNFGGMTRFSESLGKIASTNGFKVVCGYTIGPAINIFAKTGCRFSDELIASYNRIGKNIGLLVGRNLNATEIWPYTMEAVFKINTNPDFCQIVNVLTILVEHLNYVQASIRQKGVAQAFEFDPLTT